MLKHKLGNGRALGAKKPKLKTRDLEEDVASAQYFMTALCAATWSIEKEEEIGCELLAGRFQETQLDNNRYFPSYEIGL
jgi:hypothetical protein